MKAQLAPVSRPGHGLRVLSFFSGGGGLDLGFEAAGFDIIRASDIDGPSCRTLALNRGTFYSPELEVVEEDVTKLSVSSLPRHVDLIIGGPPCQSFSASGRRAGGAAGRLDGRGNLFRAYCDIVAHVQPRAFVFENVRGILSTNGGEDWKAIVEAFGALGYRLSHRILDALDFGAPQQRERMFLVGRKDGGEFLFPQPIYGTDSENQKPYISAGEALHGVNECENLDGLRITDGKYAHLLPEVPPGQNYLFFTAKRGYPKPIFAYRSRFSDFLYKADPNQPVKTIIAKPGKYTGPLHWDNRYFSVKEYMRLQGFPDGYQFYGSRDEVIKQIGNSVSPKIAEQLAKAVAQEIFDRPAGISLLQPDYRLSFDKRKGVKASLTRTMHAKVAESTSASIVNLFRQHEYEVALGRDANRFKVAASVIGEETHLAVIGPGARIPYASFVFEISQPVALKIRTSANAPETLRVHVLGLGEADSMPQLMWDAVDDWVQRTSHYHSLFELYGHFTEPYPSFRILDFQRNSESPYAAFMEFAAEMENCSKYLDRKTLRAFLGAFTESDETAAIEKLRRMRFDIRVTETNVAITRETFILAYPFTLPHRRQMNFSVRPLVDEVETA